MVPRTGHPGLWDLCQKDELSGCLVWATNQADVRKSESAVGNRFPSWGAGVWLHSAKKKKKNPDVCKVPRLYVRGIHPSIGGICCRGRGTAETLREMEVLTPSLCPLSSLLVQPSELGQGALPLTGLEGQGEPLCCSLRLESGGVAGLPCSLAGAGSPGGHRIPPLLDQSQGAHSGETLSFLLHRRRSDVFPLPFQSR